ncbi:MAG: hypothetical protein ACOCZ8_05665, partial [Bacteroidota bacterium]
RGVLFAACGLGSHKRLNAGTLSQIYEPNALPPLTNLGFCQRLATAAEAPCEKLPHRYDQHVQKKHPTLWPGALASAQL